MIDTRIDLEGGGTAALDKRDNGSRLPHFERSEVSRAFVKGSSAFWSLKMYGVLLVQL